MTHRAPPRLRGASRSIARPGARRLRSIAGLCLVACAIVAQSADARTPSGTAT